MEALSHGLNWSSERYLLRELVGSGGMSQVYRAWDKQLDREVAVKVLHPHLAASADSRRRFSREARAVAKLHHPHILEIFDFSGDGEGAYIVTEFIQGTTLRRFQEEVGFGLPQIGALAAHSLCLALEHAHAAGIVHRDLKPENVMVSSRGVLKLMDFGIARFLDQGEKMTMTGAMVGSPAYMAPEVIEGKEADARSDLFSLGTLLYWLLTGALPFDAPNTSALLKRVLDAQFRDPRLVAPAVSDSMAAILFSLLKRDPALRPESAAAVRVSLAAALAEDGVAAPDVELKSFLADPAAYRGRFRGELLSRLKGQTQTALKEGRFTGAVKLADRVLALEPNDADTRKVLNAISTRRQRQKWMRRATGAATGLVALAIIGWFGRAIWLQRPVPAQPPQVAETSPPAETTAPPPAVTESQEPSPAAVVAQPAALEITRGTDIPGPQRPPKTPLHAAAPARPSPHGAKLAAAPANDATLNKPYDVTVNVRPWAYLSVDGKPPQQAPAPHYDLHLPVGHHSLEFSREGYQPAKQDVEVNALKTPPVTQEMTPLPAHLRVIADPPEAIVMIDSQSYGSAGNSPFSIPLKEKPTATVFVEVLMAGYRPYHAPVDVRSAEEKKIVVKLQPQTGTP